ncbi:hypothetical protein CLOSYM_01226 [[Clostridium] symbiosum ATCC 14940]|uniref:Uncharacterized protein n=1 Tax=[Clostridium] symbiosum ATCC 14940 TaxID=411472 RepID=A0ABC9U0P7_CLOSY|nr:hypothetical protein CLOSYM_01226 [[Clostridium] symbiosum ATCC 14940]
MTCMLCAQVTAINKTAPGRSSVKRGSLKQSGRIKCPSYPFM